MIQCKRAYDPASPADGYRVLIDRLWPRNMRKDHLVLNAWLPDTGPTTPLRKAFKSGAMNFADFCAGYRQELTAHPEHWWPLLEPARQGTLTLVYSAKDTEHNNAVVLREWLEEELDKQGPQSSPVCYAGSHLK